MLRDCACGGRLLRSTKPLVFEVYPGVHTIEVEAEHYTCEDCGEDYMWVDVADEVLRKVREERARLDLDKKPEM